MDIKITQQVSATFARNNFKKVVDQTLKDGICWIMRKSKPVTVMLSIDEYQALKDKLDAFHKRNIDKSKPQQKISLEELRANSVFGDLDKGFVDDHYGDISTKELVKNWGKYID